MSSDKYILYDEFGNILAKELDMDTALILIKGLFENYYKDINLEVTIKRINYEK